MLGALGGLRMIVTSIPGLMHDNTVDYESAGWIFWLGIPVFIGCLPGHRLIWTATGKRALYVRIVELFLTAPFGLFFVASPC